MEEKSVKVCACSQNTPSSRVVFRGVDVFLFLSRRFSFPSSLGLFTSPSPGPRDKFATMALCTSGWEGSMGNVQGMCDVTDPVPSRGHCCQPRPPAEDSCREARPFGHKCVHPQASRHPSTAGCHRAPFQSGCASAFQDMG